MSTHLQLQEEFGGDQVNLIFVVDGEDLRFEQSFQNGLTFEWVKNQVALKLEVPYSDVTLTHDGKPVIDPFCIVDMGLKSGAELLVQIKEGADRGFEKLRKEMADELKVVGGAPAEDEEQGH